MPLPVIEIAMSMSSPAMAILVLLIPLSLVLVRNTFGRPNGQRFDTWNPSWDNSNKISDTTLAQPTATGTAVVSNSSNASGFTWAQHLYTGLTVANLSAFLYWWGLGFDTKDNGVLIRYQNNAIETSKRLWAFANYSRFILPGAIRIGTTSSNQNLQITAFKNTNGSISIVILNTSKSDIPVTFSLQTTDITQNYIAIPYITNTLNNLPGRYHCPYKIIYSRPLYKHVRWLPIR